MRLNSNWKDWFTPRHAGGIRRDPRTVVKAVLGTFAGANLIAALFWIGPFGSSPAQLESELATLRTQLQSQQANLVRVRDLTRKIEGARGQQSEFVDAWFMDRRTASSTILSELERAAKESGLQPKDHSFVIEPVDGTDELSMMTITANYEGTYGDLVQFVNFIDRSRRFLILESIAASPQQNSAALNTRFKVNTFVRHSAEEGRLLSAITEAPPESAEPEPEALP